MITLIMTLVSIHFIALVSPGADSILVIKNSLTQGRSKGLMTAVGIGLGILVHVTYSVLGLAAIISQSLILFSIIKFAGAAYLIWLGYQILKNNSHTDLGKIASQTKEISHRSSFKEGFVTNVLNPKVGIFFLGIMTTVVQPDTPTSWLLIAGIAMSLSTILRFSLVAYGLTIEKIRSAYFKVETKINKVFGVLLVAFGIKLAFSK